MEFREWLLAQMLERGWSQADLSRHSGLSRQAISLYINGRLPDIDPIIQIAHAFNLPEVEVLRAAGKLPQAREVSRIDEQIAHLVSDPMLTDADRLLLIEIIRAMIRIANDRQGGDLAAK